MERRPISQSVREWLFGELEIWRTGGVLSDDQPARILDLYETSAEAVGRRQSLAVAALSGIAAVMVGLAALLVVSYNWAAMSATVKLAIIFGVLVGSYLIACFLRLRTTRWMTSDIVFFLASVFYGAAIWLIAQVFHIQSHYPDGVWFWAVGILPVVLFVDAFVLHALYAFLLALWVGTEILGFSGLGFFHGGWAFVRHCAFTLPLLAIPGLLWGYHKRSVATIGIYAPVLAWWAILLPEAWHWHVNPIYFVGVAGALLLLVAESHRIGSRLAVPYRFYGVLITGGVLATLSFADEIIRLLDFNVYRNHFNQNYVAGLVIGIIGMLGVLGAILMQRRDTPDKTRTAVPFATLVQRNWLPLAMMLLMAGLCFWCGAFGAHDNQHLYYTYHAYNPAKWTPQVLVPTAVSNVAMMVLAIWLMRVGLREDRSGPFAAGVIYFLLWTVLRYVDLFSDVGGMLGAAVMFLLCGIGLFAVARFWMHRKENLPSPASGRGAGDEEYLPSPIGRGAGGEGGETPNMEQKSLPQEALTLTLSQRERGPDASISQRERGQDALPAWLEPIVTAVRNHGRTLLSLGLGFQLVVLVGMIVLKAAPLWTGETVLLRVVPVDPRDMFRGDYVALSYDFSQVKPAQMSGFNVQDPDQGTAAYVSLVPEEDGKHWRMSGVSAQKPSSGKYLCGTFTGWRRIECGIESYYVQEGKGHEYEDAARQKKLSAEVALGPDGRAVLRRLHIEASLPSARPAYDNVEKYRWPTNQTYRAVCLPKAKMKIDGQLNEPEWSRANVERHFVFPWKKSDSPPTEFMAFCDDEYLYFVFRVEDSDIVARDKLRDKKDVASEDRVEIFLGDDHQMKDYFCLEIDSRGRTHDYRASYYRQLDPKWTCKGLETAATRFDKGYLVEGRIPLTTLAEMKLPRLKPGVRILCGLYRAEFSHDRSGKPNGPPIEEWISWIDPKTPEPDFHVPSSLGWLEIVE